MSQQNAPHVMRVKSDGRPYAPVEVGVWLGDAEEPFAVYRLRLRAARMLLADLAGAIADAERAFAPRQDALPLDAAPMLTTRQAE